MTPDIFSLQRLIDCGPYGEYEQLIGGVSQQLKHNVCAARAHEHHPLRQAELQMRSISPAIKRRLSRGNWGEGMQNI